MPKDSIHLSIVSPVYQAENSIDDLIFHIKKHLEQTLFKFEIILVDDGSHDRSWEIIKQVCKDDKAIKGIKLSKNFGQHYAITAGIEKSNGDYVVVMDCDLQEHPKYIKSLIKEKNNGYDIILTQSKKKKQNFFKNISSRLFNLIFNFLIDDDIIKSDYHYCTLSLISREVADTYLKLRDQHRHYIKALLWLGFSRKIITIDHRERNKGVSSYSLTKLIKHALDGIVAHSQKLLWISIYSGFFLFISSLFSIVFIIIKYFLTGFLAGWPSIVILIILSTGLILFSLGILGIYIGKIFDQAKGRPLYIIQDLINFEKQRNNKINE